MKLQRLALPAAVTAGAIAAIGWLTLKSAPEQAFQTARTPLDCLVCGDVGLADVLLNVALFVPLGAGLAGLGRSFRFTVLAAFFTSVTVELLQLTVVAGRDATLGDILSNTTGGMLGWALVAFGLGLLHPASRRAAALAVVGSSLWSAAFAVSAWALHPDPAAGVYWGQWDHHFPGRGAFGGKVVRATLDGGLLPDGPLGNTEQLRRELGSGTWTLDVQARSGRPWEDNAQILGLANDRAELFLEWRQKGRDYEFSMRSRAARLRLHSVELLLPDAAPPAPGVPLSLRAEWRAGIVTLSATGAGRTTTRHLVLAPSGNWRFVWPWGRNRGEYAGAEDAIWVAVSLVGIGYWVGRARAVDGPDGRERGRRLWVIGGAVGMIAGVMLAVPAIAGLQRTSAADWGAAALGLGVGAALAYIPSARSASGP